MIVLKKIRNVFSLSLVGPFFSTYRKSFVSDPSIVSKEATMRVLNVAEKNDAAKNIAGLLSGFNVFRREGRSKYNKIYEFDYDFNGRKAKMVMTSVSGHLLTYEFTGTHRKWNTCSPEALFDAPVVKGCPEDFKNIKETLEKEARTCDALIIWTDCDREGENIGFEVISVCTSIKPNLTVYRAKFSEITKTSVKRAMQNLGQPNQMVSNAVDVRSELDLRIGASFTRFQTLRLQRVFPEVLQNCLISYGSCQFPTLGFVVERYKAVQNFIPEKFWKIKVTHTIKEVTVEFMWKRVRLFDQLFCQVLYERCRENRTAKVENVEMKPKSKYRPVPLDTVELEKIASRKLKINAKETMRIAERLYSQGFISYPRTETNIFPNNMNLNGLVELHTGDNRWGQFATKVLGEGITPRQGKKSDQAHPPIHPIKHTDGLSGNEAKVYEYIVRHFLACLSKNAEGMETIVNIDINGEKFVANGLIILELNYLEVYPYEKWNAKEIHDYKNGQTFDPTTLEMVDGETSPPNLLTEADLISLMEKHGIGTDATHAEHIETIKQRMYVGLQDRIYFVPGELGIGLVEGYDSMGFEMSKPHLRAELEADLKMICDGVKDPKVVLASQIKKYKEVFIKAVEQANKLDLALNKYLQTEANAVDNNFDTLIDGLPETVMKCPNCGSPMILKHRPNNSSYVSCTGFPQCRNSIWLPSKVIEVKLAPNTCAQCGPDVHLLTFKFRPGSMPPYYSSVHTGCVGGCDDDFLKLLDIRNPRVGINPPPPANQVASTYRADIGSFPQPFPRRTNATQNDVRGDDNDVQCNCGIAAKKLVVQKESVNKGRSFYACSKPLNDAGKCNFFMWADGDARQAPHDNVGRGPMSLQNMRNAPGGSNFQNRNSNTFKAKKKTVNSRTTTSSRRCGNCRREGHTRNNCPLLQD